MQILRSQDLCMSHGVLVCILNMRARLFVARRINNLQIGYEQGFSNSLDLPLPAKSIRGISSPARCLLHDECQVLSLCSGAGFGGDRDCVGACRSAARIKRWR